VPLLVIPTHLPKGRVFQDNFGTHRNGLRRFRCSQCKKTYTEAHKPALEGSYIPQAQVVLALRLLIEGTSIRSTERIINLDRNTIMRLLILAGEKCEKLMGRMIVNVPVANCRVR
jgi:transposase-like protein